MTMIRKHQYEMYTITAVKCPHCNGTGIEDFDVATQTMNGPVMITNQDYCGYCNCGYVYSIRVEGLWFRYGSYVPPLIAHVATGDNGIEIVDIEHRWEEVLTEPEYQTLIAESDLESHIEKMKPFVRADINKLIGLENYPEEKRRRVQDWYEALACAAARVDCTKATVDAGGNLHIRIADHDYRKSVVVYAWMGLYPSLVNETFKNFFGGK